MPNLARQKKEFSEHELEQFLADRKSAIDIEAAQTAETLGQSRARAGTTASNLASQFGAEGTKLATQQFEPVKTELATKANEGLELQKIRQRREFFNQNYNFALGRFQQANFDKVKAQEEAMKYALEQDNRAFQSEQAAGERTQATEKEELISRYSNLIAGDRQRAAQEAQERAFKMALIQSLVGLGSSVATAGIIKKVG